MLEINQLDHKWHNIMRKALNDTDQEYLEQLKNDTNWLPGIEKIFNAFSITPDEIKYILFGESPYPRTQSANGYAFWDNAVKEIWSDSGLSKPINRATSLRNFIKMLLISEGYLKKGQSTQEAIAKINKSPLIKTLDQLFEKLIKKGFLLLNASLVLSERPVLKEARYWENFMVSILNDLHDSNPNITLLLWGNIAKKINSYPIASQYPQLRAEHPYNISFINNREMIEFFSPMKLLSLNDE